MDRNLLVTTIGNLVVDNVVLQSTLLEMNAKNAVLAKEVAVLRPELNALEPHEDNYPAD